MNAIDQFFESRGEAPQSRPPSGILMALWGYIGKGASLAVVAVAIWVSFAAWLKPAIVVEALSVPKSFSDAGYTGQVVASRIMDRMAALTRIGNRLNTGKKISAEPPDVPLKVQVSGFGISIEEGISYLRSIVGRDTHISGEIVVPPAGSVPGDVGIRLRVDGNEVPCRIVAEKLDAAVADAAECAFQAAQPDMYARYIANRLLKKDCEPADKDCVKRIYENRILAEQLFAAETKQENISPEDRAWALEGLGHQIENDASDMGDAAKIENDEYTEILAKQMFSDSVTSYEAAVEDYRQSKSLLAEPLVRTNFADTVIALREVAYFAGDDRAQLDAVLALTQTVDVGDSQQAATARERRRRLDFYHGMASTLVGDYDAAAHWFDLSIRACAHREAGNDKADKCNPEAGKMYPLCAEAQSQEIAIENSFCGDAGDKLLLVRALAHDETAIDEIDALDKLDLVVAANAADGRWFAVENECGQRLLFCAYRDSNLAALALSFAAHGDLVQARLAIAPTSSGCDFCLRARGRISALAGDWQAADTAFRAAEQHGPRLPQTYTEWAEMLMANAAAVRAPAEASALREQAREKLERARDLGPRFAEVHELSGKLLLMQHAPAQAIEEFETAARFAPKWAQTRREWAQALRAIGQRKAADDQERIADMLDLEKTPART